MTECASCGIKLTSDDMPFKELCPYCKSYIDINKLKDAKDKIHDAIMLRTQYGRRDVNLPKGGTTMLWENGDADWHLFQIMANCTESCDADIVVVEYSIEVVRKVKEKFGLPQLPLYANSYEVVHGKAPFLTANQVLFISDAEKQGLSIRKYSGRYMFGKKCPAVVVSKFSDFTTTAKIEWDNMGMDFVVYAKE